jgi:homogentisate 1,2-dioxygenase
MSVTVSVSFTCPEWCIVSQERHRAELGQFDGGVIHEHAVDRPGDFLQPVVRLGEWPDATDPVVISFVGGEITAAKARRIAAELLHAADIADGGIEQR